MVLACFLAVVYLMCCQISSLIHKYLSEGCDGKLEGVGELLGSLKSIKEVTATGEAMGHGTIRTCCAFLNSKAFFFSVEEQACGLSSLIRL